MGGLFILVIIFALIVFAIIASIVIGLFFTGLIGGLVLLFTGKHFSKDSRRKVLSRVCIIIGIILLCIAGGSAGVIINFIMSMVG
ncbi:hypothetical protein SAMN02745247_02183 [Butyrivibrio hungatei DSM 14810]|uniref:Uncharacterized protein n=2 Tax=Butyrivibrio hungatei TaxID=185008 RepID=A0A1D9P160_9FIRM|nr:hypothetical protein [Butyrivibrio hungatei]AOZ96243.1 hypothetical protein bhn_I1209 [Butyrivibrio hungatei]SHN60154.1 hypothetical protein SAMN02745247_02183 [Butyrivibrio hungatei DSM 14810]